MATSSSFIESVNAISVVVLVLVTAYYAWTTRKILNESVKMRKAAEKQAIAGDSAASAAFATLHHLREQVEDLQGLGKSIVLTTADSLIRRIEDWEKLDIKANFGIASAFPSPDDLVPEHSQVIIEHARRISSDCAIAMSAAIDDLRSAKGQIETLRGVTRDIRAFFDPARYDPNPFLAGAFSKLQEVRKLVS